MLFRSGLDHCQKVTCGRESSILSLEVDCPGVRCKVIQEGNGVPIFPIGFDWLHLKIRVDQFKRLGCPCFGGGEGFLCHLPLRATGAKVFRGDFNIRKILDIFPSLSQHFSRGVREASVHSLEINTIDSGETIVLF